MELIDEKAEEILEAIWTSSESKEYTLDATRRVCDVTIIDQDLLDLETNGLIVRSGNKILFSSNGKTVAETIIRRHRLAKVLLSSILKLRHSQIDEIACKLEHTLLPEVEEAICTLLGHPEICPDGKPIPRGRCCGKKLHVIDNVVARLSDMKAGEKGKVSFIKPDTHSQLHKILSFGLNPGVVVTVHQTRPVFCICFDNTQLALDAEIASNIFIVRISNGQDRTNTLAGEKLN